MNRLISFMLILLLYFILALSLIYTSYDVWPDEVYIADISKNFLKEGRFYTELWGETIPFVNKFILWYPPVEFMILGGVYSIFGFSLESTRGTSIILGGLSVGIFYFLARELLGWVKGISKEALNTLSSVFSIAFLSDYRVLIASTLGRPEIYTIFFGLTSVLLIIYSDKYPRFQKMLIFLGGLASGLSILAHFSGVIFASYAAGLFFYLKNYSLKQIRGTNSMLFGTGLLIPISLWLFFIRGEFQIFLEQMRLQMEFRNVLSPSLPALFSLRNEFVIVLKKIVLLITLALSIFLPLYTKGFKKTLPFITALALAWYINMSGKLSWYYVYIAVAVYLLAIVKAGELYEGFKKRGTTVISASLGLVFLNLLIFASNPAGFFNYSHDYYAFSKEVEKHVEKGSIIYTSAAPDPYFYLNQRGVKFILFPGLLTDEKSFLNHIKHADYILKNEQIGIFSQLKNYVDYATENYEISKEIEAGGYHAQLYKKKD